MGQRKGSVPHLRTKSKGLKPEFQTKRPIITILPEVAVTRPTRHISPSRLVPKKGRVSPDSLLKSRSGQLAPLSQHIKKKLITPPPCTIDITKSQRFVRGRFSQSQTYDSASTDIVDPIPAVSSLGFASPTNIASIFQNSAVKSMIVAQLGQTQSVDTLKPQPGKLRSSMIGPKMTTIANGPKHRPRPGTSKQIRRRPESQVQTTMNKPLIPLSLEQQIIQNTFTLIEFIPVLISHTELHDKYWYLQQVPNSHYYDLRFFQPSQDDDMSDGWTISIRGLTRYLERTEEFFPIKAFYKELQNYERLRQIGFIRKYKQWKVFIVWKKLRRQKMMMTTIQLLQKKLVYLDSRVQKACLDVRKALAKMEVWETLILRTDQPRSLDQFVDAQERLQRKIEKRYQYLENQIINRLRSGCQHSYKHFLKLSQLPESQQEGQYQKYTLESKEPFLCGDDEYENMPYTKALFVRAKLLSLGRFVLAVSYMLFTAKNNLVKESVSRISKTICVDFEAKRTLLFGAMIRKALAKMDPQIKFKGKPLFIIQVIPQLGPVKSYPSDQRLIDKLVEALQKLAKFFCVDSELHKHPEFEKFTKRLAPEKEKDEIPEIYDPDTYYRIMIQSPVWVKNIQQMQAGIKQTFGHVMDHVESLQKYVKIYDKSFEVDCAETQGYGLSVKQIKEAMDRYLDQIALLEEMPTYKDISVFGVDSEELKTLLEPIPQKGLKHIQSLLPEMIDHLTKKLAAKITRYNELIEEIPVNVDQFVVYRRNLRRVQDKQDALQNLNNRIKEVVSLMDAYRIKVPNELVLAYTQCQTELVLFNDKILSDLDRLEDDMTVFIRELKTNVTANEKAIRIASDQLDDPQFRNPKSYPGLMVQLLGEIGKTVRPISKASKAYITYTPDLNIEQLNFDEVFEVNRAFKQRFNLWKAIFDLTNLRRNWIATPFSAIDAGTISDQLEAFEQIAQSSIVVKDEDLGRLIKRTVTDLLFEMVEELQATVPVVTLLRDETLQSRHWERLHTILGVQIDLSSENFTFGSLIELKVQELRTKIEKVVEDAQQESQLKRSISIINASWKDVEIPVLPYKGTKDYYVIGDTTELQQLLEDTIIMAANVVSSKHVAIVWEEITPLQKTLRAMATTFDEWMEVQHKWIFMENIINSTPDVRYQLMQEVKRFFVIDTGLKNLMKQTYHRPAAQPILNSPELLTQLKEWNTKLDQIHIALEDYLEKKRRHFARFYFLSNEELFDIIAHMRNVNTVQPHLKKCFGGISKIEFHDASQNDSIYAVVSSEGEVLELSKGLRARGSVEEWLSNVEGDMVKTIKKELINAHQHYMEHPGARVDWVKTSQTQLALLVDSLMWCHGTEDALSFHGDHGSVLGDWQLLCLHQLDELVRAIQTDLTEIQRIRVISLITQDVHNRDVIETLRKDRITNAGDFKWQIQLRGYWIEEEQECYLRQASSEFHYGYEFLGAVTRLVITPLTDRAVITITGAMSMRLGAVLTGPAGTGKTETCKDIAKVMGRFCFVLNCTAQLTNQTISRLLRGLCASGAWSSLDELNRMNVEVLSVMANQLLQIKNAKLQGKADFMLEDKMTRLNSHTGIFMTMNPDYIGRTDLPDNLKALFRPVALMVPEYYQIAEVILYSQGFLLAPMLSKKIAKLYQLCSQQLSSQDHYDFGMRSVKSLLQVVGLTKQMHPAWSEENVTIKAMRGSNIPKLVKADLPLFEALLKDLFPQAECPTETSPVLIDGMQTSCKRLGLQPTEELLLKTAQLCETIQTRTGTIVVGAPNTAKTTAIKLLQATNNFLHGMYPNDMQFQVTHTTSLYPMVLSMAELFGYYDKTGEWRDGIIAKSVKQFTLADSNDFQWIIFDGPCWSGWVENLNTMLDDNLVLCLASTERVKIRKEMKVIFEVEDLAVASPSTISRCGMIYTRSDTIDWISFTQKQIDTQFVTWKPALRHFLFRLMS